MNTRSHQPGNEPFGRYPRRLFEDPALMAALNKSDLAVILQVGMLLSAGTWTAFITSETLAQRCGCDRSTVHRSVKRLIEMGILVRPRNGRLGFNLESECCTGATVENTEGRTCATIPESDCCTHATEKAHTCNNSQDEVLHPCNEKGAPVQQKGRTGAPHSRISSRIHSTNGTAARLTRFDFSIAEASALLDRLGEQAIIDVIDSVQAADPGEIRNPAGWVRSALDRVAAGTFEVDVRVKARRKARCDADAIEAQRLAMQAEFAASRESVERERREIDAALAGLSDAAFGLAAEALLERKSGTYEELQIRRAIKEGRARESRTVRFGVYEHLLETGKVVV